MGEKIIVGPINKGLRNDRTAFVIDNDSFPTLINAYQWRGRIKRKRGTSFLNRLQRFWNSLSVSYNTTGTTTQTLSSGAGNLFTGFTGFTFEVDAQLVPGSITINDETASITYTDPEANGILVGDPSGSGTVNYITGAITIAAGGSDVIDANFIYYPDLPVMGLEDFVMGNNPFPGTIGFDTTYSYNILQSAPYAVYDISFYKNPLTSTYPLYVQKTNVTPTTWNGQNYQQFWTTNYQGAMWATNGINVPFSTSNIGMQFAPKATITFVSQTATTITVTITNCPLVIGDFVFLNEWTAASVTNAATLNFQTGYVTATSGMPSSLTVTINLPNAAVATTTYTPGIIQYLTNRSSTTTDCLRWYDGDPTDGIPNPPALNGHLGWVNFMPPLSQASFSIANLPQAQYYLVGARIILPFKDRLLFIGPVIQSSVGSPIYLQDTVIYSQNGTVYYTCSFQGDPRFPTSPPGIVSLLVPSGQTATASAYFEDSTGYGGNVTAGLDQPIITASPNEDVLILGFSTVQTRLIYSGSDFIPFNFFVTNSELGSGSTFSQITMDEGVITRGTRGYIITSQVQAQRIDLEIPDEVFQINLLNNGNERFCAQRDFINEWIYFTYPVSGIPYNFPNTTLQYNYRDQSWATFYECYTTYGSFRAISGYTWATIGEKYETWSVWNEPWNSGASTLLQPKVIGGNQQGFILLRDDGTNEGNSLFISNISFPAIITNITQAAQAVVTANNQFIIGQSVMFSGVAGMTQINGLSPIIVAATPTQFTIALDTTGFSAYSSGGIAMPVEPLFSPNHSLNDGDYIIISGCLGTIAPDVNSQIFSVGNPTVNGFTLEAESVPTSGTYLGGGEIQRLYVPFIQSKQFPVSWNDARKTRLGPQHYLLSTTANSQITLLIFLSQNPSDGDILSYNFNNAYNVGPIVPGVNVINNTLIYANVLYTCPESTNLGLTPANINLNMVTAINQAQIWHRMNTSLLGDTVQVGFTLSDAQMRTLTPNTTFFTITGATNNDPCVLTCENDFAVGQLILITGVLGMGQLNNNIYYISAVNSTTITINVDSTYFGTYSSGGMATVVGPEYQTAEIELHVFILDVSPSQMLA